jgi:hypothetical protein
MLHYTQRGDAPIDRVHPEMRRQVVGQVILVLWAMRFSSGLWFSIRVAYFSQVLDVFYVEICEKCVRHRRCTYCVHVAADISGSNRNPDSVIDAVLGLCQLRSTLDSILPLDHLVLDSDTESIKEL